MKFTLIAALAAVSEAQMMTTMKDNMSGKNMSEWKTQMQAMMKNFSKAMNMTN